jgi:GST-like protein
MAVWPWLRAPDFQGVEIAEYPNVRRWRAGIAERPAVQRALLVLEENNRNTPHSDEQWEIMFGSIQYQRR